jgi:hypothetical protein
MSPLSHFKNRGHKSCCAAVVLVAVCALTVSLATRYYAPDASSHTVKKIQPDASSSDVKKQRLAKNAANWIPPVDCGRILPTPSYQPMVIPVGPPAPILLFEESLYNRPPPASESLA